MKTRLALLTWQHNIPLTCFGCCRCQQSVVTVNLNLLERKFLLCHMQMITSFNLINNFILWLHKAFNFLKYLLCSISMNVILCPHFARLFKCTYPTFISLKENFVRNQSIVKGLNQYILVAFSDTDQTTKTTLNLIVFVYILVYESRDGVKMSHIVFSL